MSADNNGTITLAIPAALTKQIRSLALASRPNETGGILIGRYSADLTVATVVQVTRPPRDSRSGPTWFTRGTYGLNRLLERAWRDGLHYLGEWHYHPEGLPEPSATDRAQMSAITCEAKMQCATPVLLILGDADAGRQIAAYVHIDNELFPLTLADDANKIEPHLGRPVRG